MTALCAAPRHGDDEVEAEPSAQLCRPCRLGLSADLRRLPGLHADLEHAVQVTAGDGTGLPFSEPASECRDQIRHDVGYWARHITGLRGLGAPPVLLPGWAQDPVLVMCGWLHGQVTWCSFRDWAPDMAGAISADRARAVALLDPWVIKHPEIPSADALCLECGQAKMEVTIYQYSNDKRRSTISCPACGTHWDFGADWLPFLRRVIKRRNLRETTGHGSARPDLARHDQARLGRTRRGTTYRNGTIVL